MNHGFLYVSIKHKNISHVEEGRLKENLIKGTMAFMTCRPVTLVIPFSRFLRTNSWDLISLLSGNDPSSRCKEGQQKTSIYCFKMILFNLIQWTSVSRQLTDIHMSTSDSINPNPLAEDPTIVKMKSGNTDCCNILRMYTCTDGKQVEYYLFLCRRWVIILDSKGYKKIEWKCRDVSKEQEMIYCILEKLDVIVHTLSEYSLRVWRKRSQI